MHRSRIRPVLHRHKARLPDSRIPVRQYNPLYQQVFALHHPDISVCLLSWNQEQYKPYAIHG